MRFFYLLTILFFVLSSCVPQLNYLGASLGTSQQVDVFVSEDAILKPYIIIGQSEVSQFWTSYTSKMAHASIQKQAIQKAKSVGADAILYTTYSSQAQGSKIASRFQIDSIGGSVIGNSTTTVTPIYTGGIFISYLQYKN
jgi:hypothetical protein